MPLQLYLLQRPEDDQADFDQYIGCVAAAWSEDDARKIHPKDEPGGKWVTHDPRGGWVPPESLIVTLLGDAGPNIKRGVVLASFKAG